MRGVEQLYLFNFIQFVIIKYFYIVIIQKIEIDFITVVPDGYHKAAFLVQ